VGSTYGLVWRIAILFTMQSVTPVRAADQPHVNGNFGDRHSKETSDTGH
jgi:hypothetical protein